MRNKPGRKLQHMNCFEKNNLKDVLDTLTDREENVLRLRFGSGWMVDKELWKKLVKYSGVTPPNVFVR